MAMLFGTGDTAFHQEDWLSSPPCQFMFRLGDQKKCIPPSQSLMTLLLRASNVITHFLSFFDSLTNQNFQSFLTFSVTRICSSVAELNAFQGNEEKEGSEYLVPKPRSVVPFHREALSISSQISQSILRGERPKQNTEWISYRCWWWICTFLRTSKNGACWGINRTQMLPLETTFLGYWWPLSSSHGPQPHRKEFHKPEGNTTCKWTSWLMKSHRRAVHFSWLYTWMVLCLILNTAKPVDTSGITNRQTNLPTALRKISKPEPEESPRSAEKSKT